MVWLNPDHAYLPLTSIYDGLPDWNERVLILCRENKWHLGYRTKDYNGLHVWCFDDEVYLNPPIKPAYWVRLPEVKRD